MHVICELSIEFVGAGRHLEHVAAGPDPTRGAASAQGRCATHPGSGHLPRCSCQKFHQLYRPG